MIQTSIPKRVKKILSFFSRYSFDVYLIHTNLLIFSIFKDKFTFLSSFNTFSLLMDLLALIVFIYFVCSIIGYLIESIILTKIMEWELKFEKYLQKKHNLKNKIMK